MKRWLVLLALATGCGGAAAAVEPERPAETRTATPVPVEEAAKGVAEQYRQAYEVRSFDALSQLYARNLDLVVAHQGTSHAGWTAVETHLKALLEGSQAIHIKLDDVVVTAMGSGAASVVATMKREINDGTSAVVERGVLTLFVRNEADSWVIVTEHFSYPPR